VVDIGSNVVRHKELLFVVRANIVNRVYASTHTFKLCGRQVCIDKFFFLGPKTSQYEIISDQASRKFEVVLLPENGMRTETENNPETPIPNKAQNPKIIPKAPANTNGIDFFEHALKIF